MNFPITLDKLAQMTQDIRRSREEDMRTVVYTGVANPETILYQLQQDLKDSIDKNDRRTEFSYTLVSYYRIFERYGKDDVLKLMSRMATQYVYDSFPAATISIDVDHDTVSILLHFTLPWLSDQTSSRQPQE